MCPKSKARRFKGGTITPTKHNTFLATVTHQYKQHRKVLPTECAAEDWIIAAVHAVENNQKPLSSFELDDARQARAILPKGVTLLEVARQYAATHISEKIPLDKAVKEYLAEKEAKGLRPDSLIAPKVALKRLSRLLSPCLVDNVSVELIEGLLGNLGVSGKTQNNNVRDFKTFFNWCIKRGYCTENPALQVVKVRLDQTLPGVLTPHEAESLMSTAAEKMPVIVPYLAVSMFAGLRVREAQELDAGAITDHIRVDPEIAKSRRLRNVDIQDNLHGWLKVFPTQGKLGVPGLRLKVEKVRRWAGITNWPNNAFRHSFASYHYALYESDAKTAAQLGQASMDVFFNHYRTLVTKAEAEQYFAIYPTVT